MGTTAVSDETLKGLLQQKQDLALQIARYEENLEKARKGEQDGALIARPGGRGGG